MIVLCTGKNRGNLLKGRMSHGGRVIETFFPRKRVGRRACP